DLDDRRVGEARRGPGLAAEALASRLVLRLLGTDELDRHPAVQPAVVGLVDLPHATGSEPLFESVGSDRLGKRCHETVRVSSSRVASSGVEAPAWRLRGPPPWR